DGPSPREQTMTSTPRRQIFGLTGWLALVFIAGGIGAWASVDAASFYAELKRPAWAPPAAVFGPVWTALYIMMGVAAWLVWREGPSPIIRRALVLFVVQLALNVLWSWLFFGWHLGALAFLDIIVLLTLIVATLVAFWHIKLLAGVLLAPYAAWVAFAAVLNYSVWQLNPTML